MNWFYAKNGSQQGPLSTDEIKSRIAMGEIGPSDLAWCEGMSDWLPIGQIPQLKIEAPVREEAPPAAAAPPFSSSPSPYQAPVSPAGSQVPAQMPPGQTPSQGLAIGSLVCGILTVLMCCPSAITPLGIFSVPIAIAAVVMGHIAVSKHKKNPAANGGKGMARAGLIMGYLAFLGPVIFIGLNIWVSTMPPQEVEDKVINLFPPEMRQQMRDQIEAGKAKQQQR